MKKFFTSMLMMLGCVAAMSAQTVTLQKGAEGEVTYNPGDVIEVKAEDYYGGNKWDPELYLLSKTSTTVTATLSCESTQQGVQFCGGSDCMMTSPGRPVEKKITLNGGDPLPMQIDIVDFAGTALNSEDVTATFTVQTLTKTSTYTIKFLARNNAGINDVDATANAVSVSGRSLAYSFTQPTVLTLYTISGQAAVNYTLNGNGTLSLDALPGGVYIYRAGTHTGKFVVR